MWEKICDSKKKTASANESIITDLTDAEFYRNMFGEFSFINANNFGEQSKTIPVHD